MPPRAKFTREEILEAALSLLREKGPEGVTARELGVRLHSSARPIFTVFESMEEVHREVRRAAKDLYRQYVKEGLSKPLAFRGVGMAYVRFANREPRLFQLLFMTEQEKPENVDHTLPIIEESYEEILRSVQEPYGLSPEDAKRLYRHLWVYTHGIAVLCAAKAAAFTEQEAEEMMTEVFVSLLSRIKASSGDKPAENKGEMSQ